MKQKKGKTVLTDLEVTEVSLVDRGAIGEVFTVIKSEEEPDNKETVSLSDEINKLSDEEFVETMHEMMHRYKEINNDDVNKGGSNTMDKELKEIFDSFMETVNKNFAAVNAELSDIKKRDEEAEAKAKAEDEKSKAEADAKQKEENKVDEVAKALSEVAKVVNDLKDTVSKMSDLKLDEALKDVTKRIETIEKSEIESNQPKDAVNKSENETKTVFWKSFLGE